MLLLKEVLGGLNLAEPSDYDIQKSNSRKNSEQESTLDYKSDQLTNSMNSSTTNKYAQPEIRMRCPNCFKLYAVDPQTIYVEKPEFDCVSCDQKFWISFPEALEHSEIVAFPIEWSEQYKSELEANDRAYGNASLETEETLDPKIIAKMSMDISDKIKAPETDGTSGIRKVGFIDDVETELNSEYWFLEKSWEKVLNNYDVKSVHKDFILSARAKQSLDFALGKYKSFCEANGHDQVSKEMKLYCEKLIQDFAIHQSVLGSKSKGKKTYLRLIPWVVISMSAGLIGLGFSNESLSDLAGFGFALIFLTGALLLLKESDL